MSAEVGIVGLGLAGLRVAGLLEDAGVEVALFEAAPAAGGRLRTAEPIRGVVYEAGAEWIDADHARVRSLLAELGLERAPAAPNALVLHGDERRSLTDLWEDARRDRAAVETAAEALCRRLGPLPWSGALAERFDRTTLAEFLGEIVRTDAGRFWVERLYRSDEGEELERVSLLGWLSCFTHYVGRRGDEAGAYRLACTSTELCGRLLDGLRAEARYGATLRAVEQRSGAVALHFDSFRVEVERAVLTLPPPCLRHVAFAPPLAERRRAAVEACGFGRGVKLGLLFAEPWWRAHAAGRMHGDGILQDVWETAGSAPLLCVYVCGDAAIALARCTDAPARAVAALARHFPEATRTYRKGWIHDWTADSRAGGVHSHFPPGYLLEHFAAAAEPEGRVHFAGEYTARWNGFLEGALESAERVVGELLGDGGCA